MGIKYGDSDFVNKRLKDMGKFSFVYQSVPENTGAFEYTEQL